MIDLAKNKNINGVIHKEVDSCHTILDIKLWIVTFQYEDEVYSITFVNHKDWEDRIKMVGEDSDGNKEFFSVDGEFAELKLA